MTSSLSPHVRRACRLVHGRIVGTPHRVSLSPRSSQRSSSACKMKLPPLNRAPIPPGGAPLCLALAIDRASTDICRRRHPRAQLHEQAVADFVAMPADQGNRRLASCATALPRSSRSMTPVTSPAATAIAILLAPSLFLDRSLSTSPSTVDWLFLYETSVAVAWYRAASETRPLP